MKQKRRTRSGRVLTIGAWLSMVVLGVLEIRMKDHGVPRLGAMFQIAVALIAVVAEITGLLQEPS